MNAWACVKPTKKKLTCCIRDAKAIDTDHSVAVDYRSAHFSTGAAVVDVEVAEQCGGGMAITVVMW